MQINALSIDDDPMSILLVKSICKHFDFINLQWTYTDPIKGAAGIVIKKPDLVFLDVEMPNFTGIQILRNLTRIPKIVVMSSNINFEQTALNLDATAFIQKPATLEKLKEVILQIKQDIEKVKGHEMDGL
jgi:two-component SAPR family response regulator